jgi:hypothetical protein
MKFRRISAKMFTRLTVRPVWMWDFIILVLYKISLDIVYNNVVYPMYGYTGMINNFTLYKYFISTILFFLLLVPIANLIRNPGFSALFVSFLNLIYFIPGCTLYAFAGLPDAYFLFFSLYWIILLMLNRLIPSPDFKYLTNQSGRLLLFSSLIVIVLIGTIISGVYNGLRLHFSLSDVYELRYAQRDIDLPAFFRYFQPIAATITPVAIVYCLINKLKVWSIVLIFIQLLSFGFGGARTTLISLFVALTAYFFYNQKRVIWMAYGVLFLNIASLIEYLIRHFSIVTSLAQFRIFFIPTLLSYNYYDFFSQHELLYWRASILGRLGFDSPYSLPIPHLIGKIYANDVTNSANNGLCGDAFSNFGWFSLLIFPFLIILFSKLTEGCIKKLDARIIITTVVVFAFGFTNASFFGLMLSNGFLFAIIFLYIVSKPRLI